MKGKSEIKYEAREKERYRDKKEREREMVALRE